MTLVSLFLQSWPSEQLQCGLQSLSLGNLLESDMSPRLWSDVELLETQALELIHLFLLLFPEYSGHGIAGYPTKPG